MLVSPYTMAPPQCYFRPLSRGRPKVQLYSPTGISDCISRPTTYGHSSTPQPLTLLLPDTHRQISSRMEAMLINPQPLQTPTSGTPLTPRSPGSSILTELPSPHTLNTRNSIYHKQLKFNVIPNHKSTHTISIKQIYTTNRDHPVPARNPHLQSTPSSKHTPSYIGIPRLSATHNIPARSTLTDLLPALTIFTQNIFQSHKKKITRHLTPSHPGLIRPQRGTARLTKNRGSPKGEETLVRIDTDDWWALPMALYLAQYLVHNNQKTTQKKKTTQTRSTKKPTPIFPMTAIRWRQISRKERTVPTYCFLNYERATLEFEPKYSKLIPCQPKYLGF